ncbi:non-oxidative hydroxyarylic acid decarboxylases subunit D [Saccharopolyspora gloriosae]|uniref:non-oxidative hydroxyarylic acid decarboxylases subunit D n=1 Tax=Saccharopolyspora gloriosae TaxID=455344 RepID=UPI001FB6A0E3|nr:non-oxidative hydroxyarylic acid decarboxylases subunit D [Saccharopolyspora gloriosae]
MCPRCAAEELTRQAVSPVAGVWEVWRCERCHYFWRSTEPERRTERESYPAAFRMTQADIDEASEMPAIPPRRSGS